MTSPSSEPRRVDDVATAAPPVTPSTGAPLEPSTPSPGKTPSGPEATPTPADPTAAPESKEAKTTPEGAPPAVPPAGPASGPGGAASPADSGAAATPADAATGAVPPTIPTPTPRPTASPDPAADAARDDLLGTASVPRIEPGLSQIRGFTSRPDVDAAQTFNLAHVKAGTIKSATLQIDRNTNEALIDVTFQGNNLSSKLHAQDANVKLLVSLNGRDIDAFKAEFERRFNEQTRERSWGIMTTTAADPNSVVKAGQSILSHQLLEFVRPGLLELSGSHFELVGEIGAARSLSFKTLSNLNDVRIKDCDLDGARLVGSIKDLSVSESQMRAFTFAGCQYVSGKFEILNSNLTSASATKGTNLGMLNLKGSEIIGIDLRNAEAEFKSLLEKNTPQACQRAVNEFMEDVSFTKRSTKLFHDARANAAAISQLVSGSELLEGPRMAPVSAGLLREHLSSPVIEHVEKRHPEYKTWNGLVQKNPTDATEIACMRLERPVPGEAAGSEKNAWIDIGLGSTVPSYATELPAKIYQREGLNPTDGKYTEKNSVHQPISGDAALGLAVEYLNRRFFMMAGLDPSEPIVATDDPVYRTMAGRSA